MTHNKTLVCYTASYPYGNKETYFENELEYLSKSFDKIIIIPTYNVYGNMQRPVPNNVEVYPVTLKQGKGRIIDFLKNFNLPKNLLKEFITHKVFLDKSKFKNWLISVLSYGKGINNFNSYFFDPGSTILYSYWTGQNFFIDEKLNKYKKVVRMHGGDFYLERNNNYLPLQRKIYQSADLLLPISKDIFSRLVDYYNIDTKKINLSYLGVNNFQDHCTIKTSKVLKIISCSNVYALKRIDLIYKILLEIDSTIQIEWDHIGSGDLLDELKDYVKLNSKPNVKVSFLGQKTQQEIKELYQDNYYDFFINTSMYEGLPVSVMEAFSFGIPAIATNVGGTSEIVNAENGLLIDKNFDETKVAIKVENLYKIESIKYRVNAFKTWMNNFNAENNYNEVANTIKNL
ncbi:glycosyltransferase [Empedobacter brevis]|uniref:glycosyltransferase n=1 Tax=Empedobacter brevis TaxID=247 RepID=UPI002FE1F26C